MSTIKYAIVPGYVTSVADGQRHWVGANTLMKLYGVRAEECYVHLPKAWWCHVNYRNAEDRMKSLIVLAPRYDGNYALPAEGTPFIPQPKRVVLG